MVNVNSPVTVGMINFDSANSYTIAGPGAITMAGPAGVVAINVANGSHTIAAPIVLNDDLRINVAPAASTLALAGDLAAAGRTITKTGAGAAQFEKVRAAALNVAAGTARISIKPSVADPSGTSVVQSVSLGASAKLDITNNAFIVDYAAGETQPLDTIRAQIVSAYDAGAWDGNGITSSLANATALAVGYGETSAVFASFPASFAGQPVDDSAVLIRLTRYGDATLDGVLGLPDFNRLAANFGAAGKLWTDGDFNYDGLVNLTDFNLLAGNFGLSATGPDVTPQDWSNLAAAVPEPGTSLLLLLSGVPASAGMRRRRRC
jgi:hypothetical protein